MMDEQSKFKEALASVTIRAEENGGKLSAEEAKELLKDMEFNDEQMSMIYAYLASKGYVVEGAVLPEKEQEPYTEEEEEFLEQYRKDMKSMRRQTEEVLQELFSAALAGEQEAIRPADRTLYGEGTCCCRRVCTSWHADSGSDSGGKYRTSHGTSRCC